MLKLLVKFISIIIIIIIKFINIISSYKIIISSKI